ncbi:MAG: DNA (cytosine-5-)-methyltransferase [Planctomycetota bacterium]
MSDGKAPTCIELFAGAGGLALGMACSGFEHLLVQDWNADACRTLRHNRGENTAKPWNIHESDVRSERYDALRGKVDVVAGGPPCQPFSIGGKHRGFNDQRDMFPEAVRAVRELKPKAFVFENVKGLLRENFANYFQYIVQRLRFPTQVSQGDEEWPDHLTRLEKLHTGGRFRGLRYNVVWQLLNAADYGVPQQRWRVVIVGVRADLGIRFSFPHATHGADALLHSQWVSGEYWDRHRVPMRERPEIPKRLRKRVESLRSQLPEFMPRPWSTVRDATADLPAIGVGETCLETPNHQLRAGAKSYPGHTGSPLDEPAKALKAGDHGVPGGENMLRLPDGSVRYFSVREAARIQTFPDDWVLQGSWTESMRQLGNAVPVRLASAVADRLHGVLEPSGITQAFQRNIVAAEAKARLHQQLET